MGHSGAQKCGCTCLDTFFELSLYQEYTDFKGLFFGHMTFWSARIRGVGKILQSIVVDQINKNKKKR